MVSGEENVRQGASGGGGWEMAKKERRQLLSRRIDPKGLNTHLALIIRRARLLHDPHERILTSLVAARRRADVGAEACSSAGRREW
jgi:hypothetical protein